MLLVRYFRGLRCKVKLRIICLTLGILGTFLILHAGNGPPKREVRVYLVEEHHEVLPYWYHETVLGNLNRSGNTLIHIDAHSDLASPFLYPGFPFFRWPKGEGEVLNMMQRNDMFIQAAIIIGLVNHMIWITPSWDPDDSVDSYEIYNLGVGYTIVPPNATKRFCECHWPASNLHDKTKECIMLVTEGKDTGKELTIDPDQCHVMRTVLLERIVENIALQLLEHGAWIGVTNGGVILDMDEDFFGCQSGFDELAKAGVGTGAAEMLNEKLSNVICANSGNQEAVADKFLKDYIRILISSCNLKNPEDKCTSEIEDIQIHLDAHIDYVFEEEDPDVFCSSNLETSMLMSEILPLLRQFTLRSLQAIMNQGFCLNMSPSTLGFNDGNSGFFLCHGYNLPNMTVVYLYTPNAFEMAHRKKRLHKLLDHLISDLNLRVVTLARSVRDGYTPRTYANTIEDGILAYFKQKPSRRDKLQYNIVFDSNLLGGEKGWNGRYKPPSPQNTGKG